MATLLQHLNNECVLLMYLAGELPDEDRREVDLMLAQDARLRDELEQLRAAYEGVGAALHEADAASRLVLPAGTAVRRVGQAARAWHARRLAQPGAREARGPLRVPRWAYPIAVAAAVAIGYTAWWGMQPDEPARRRLAENAESQPSVVAGASGELSPEQQIALMGPWEESPLLHDDGEAALDWAEADLFALSESSAGAAFVEDGSILLMDDTDER